MKPHFKRISKLVSQMEGLRILLLTEGMDETAKAITKADKIAANEFCAMIQKEVDQTS